MAILTTIAGLSAAYTRIEARVVAIARRFDLISEEVADFSVLAGASAMYCTGLTALVGTVDRARVYCDGYAAAGDGGGGEFVWYLGSTTTANGGTVFGAGTGRWKRVYSGALNVRWFGVTGNGTTNDTTAIVSVLAAIPSGGALYFPAGTYLVQRGNGSLLADTIVADSVTIFGDGAASVITSKNAAGNITNDTSNEFYSVFQATGRDNLVFRDLSFNGYCTPFSLYQCDGVVFDNIRDNGLLANAGGYLRDKTLYLYQCTDVRVVNCRFDNFQFAVYLSGTSGTRCKTVVVSNCHFDQTVAAGSFTALFPVGVYVYFGDDVLVTGCTFKDIYSSFDNGNTATGLGYGVYEGDGACNKLVVSSNTFHLNAKGAKQSCGVYINFAIQGVCCNNAFFAATSAGAYAAFMFDVKTTDSDRVFTGNSVKITATTGFGVYGNGSTSTTQVGRVVMSNNTVVGGLYGVSIDGLSACEVDIDGNSLRGQSGPQIQVAGAAALPLKFPRIANNRCKSGQSNGIKMAGYVVSPQITDNVILDGNLANTAGDAGAAVYFVSSSYGSLIDGNTIGNTAFGAGLFTYGVQSAANAADRIFKDIIGSNSFIGLANNFQFGRYNTASPTAGIFDASKGDFYRNTQLGSGGTPGWYVAFLLTPTLTTSASSASTTVVVNSTSSMATGQVVLLCKDSSPYDGDYYDTTKWHIDTVASVTNATDFVLTTGIPAGDGTYTPSSALRVVSFKAAAVIA